MIQIYQFTRLIIFFNLWVVNFLSIIFAAWSAGYSKSTGAMGPTIAFIISNICLIFLIPQAVFLGRIRPQSPSLIVGVECAWIASLSMLQCASAIALTINGAPEQCLDSCDITACAAVLVTTAFSWLSASIATLYTTLLIGATIAHYQYYPGLLKKPVAAFPWFDADAAEANIPLAEPRIRKSTIGFPNTSLLKRGNTAGSRATTVTINLQCSDSTSSGHRNQASSVDISTISAPIEMSSTAGPSFVHPFHAIGSNFRDVSSSNNLSVPGRSIMMDEDASMYSGRSRNVSQQTMANSISPIAPVNVNDLPRLPRTPPPIETLPRISYLHRVDREEGTNIHSVPFPSP